MTRFDTTGAELVAVLDAASLTSPLQVSGATYRWSSAAPVGTRVIAADVLIGGIALDPTRTYAVVTNSIVFDRFTAITNVDGIGVDLDALVTHFAASSPIAPPPLGRITKQ